MLINVVEIAVVCLVLYGLWHEADLVEFEKWLGNLIADAAAKFVAKIIMWRRGND